MDAALTPLLWFALVVALIPAALWLLKRTPLGGGVHGAGLRCVSVLPLSGSQRIVTVEVGQGEDRRWLVLGVTPSSITTLHTMAPQGEPPAALPAAVGSFADVLGRLRGGAAPRSGGR
ncbi:MAG: flagellar protein FliO [Pseudomonadota bacterium]|jgi:flagellar protein FliO/FliZ